MACAWAGFGAYGVSMVLSYFFGQKYYPIQYPLKDIAIYVLFAAFIFFWIMVTNRHFSTVPALLINTAWVVCYVIFIVRRDLPLKSLPYIGKYFK
jgi:hypothetical protein